MLQHLLLQLQPWLPKRLVAHTMLLETSLSVNIHHVCMHVSQVLKNYFLITKLINIKWVFGLESYNGQSLI